MKIAVSGKHLGHALPVYGTVRLIIRQVSVNEEVGCKIQHANFVLCVALDHSIAYTSGKGQRSGLDGGIRGGVSKRECQH